MREKTANANHEFNRKLYMVTRLWCASVLCWLCAKKCNLVAKVSAAESGECGIDYASIQRVEVDKRGLVASVQSVRCGDVLL